MRHGWVRSSFGFMALLLLACSPAERSDVASAPPTVETNEVARVGDRAITLDELDAWIKDELFEQATSGGDPEQLFRTRDRALRRLVDRRVLEQVGASDGIGAETVLQNAIDALPAVSETEIAAFYEEHPRSFPGEDGIEPHVAKIRKILENERRQTAMRAVRSRAEVRIDLPPPHDRFAAGLPGRGPDDAPITIVAFSDFACLDCGRAEAVLAELRARYPDDVRVVYRYVPQADSSFHHGREAAEAAHCGHRLGAHWAFHDELFAHQRDLDAEDLDAYAERVGLEAKAVARCRRQAETGSRLEADAQAAEAAGVVRLPAFLVNGQLVTGTRSLPVFSSLVESARRRLELRENRG